MKVGQLLSDPERNQYKRSYFNCAKPLVDIEFPSHKVHFIFANYALENLRCKELEPTMKKCLDNLESGGIFFIKEPDPSENKTEFDSQYQRFLRPKKVYIDILVKYGCRKVIEHTHDYRYNPTFGREYILIFKKLKDIKTPC